MQLIQVDQSLYFDKERLRNVQVIFIDGAAYFIAIGSRYSNHDFESNNKLNAITYFVVVTDRNDIQYYVSGDEFQTFVEARQFYRSVFNAKIRLNG